MDPLISPVKESQECAELLGETIEALQLAIHALSNPDARLWPTLLHLLAFTRRLESIDTISALTPSQQTVQLLRIMEENEGLRHELQQLVAKLAARSIARAIQSGELEPDPALLPAMSGRIGPFDPEVEPWLASLVARSIQE